MGIKTNLLGVVLLQTQSINSLITLNVKYVDFFQWFRFFQFNS